MSSISLGFSYPDPEPRCRAVASLLMQFGNQLESIKVAKSVRRYALSDVADAPSVSHADEIIHGIKVVVKVEILTT